MSRLPVVDLRGRPAVPRATGAPRHLVLGDPTHGVTRYAAELAGACGADVVRRPDDVRAGDGPVHLHLTDKLLSPVPAEAADAVERLAARVSLTVTLHDVPQPTDGPVFGERAAAYARILRTVDGWATSSAHEHALLHRWVRPVTDGAVLHHPVIGASGWVARPDPDPVVGVFGFVYPGKGYRQVVRAAAALCRTGTEVRVRVIGGPARRHADELDDVRRLAEARGVPLEVTGHLDDADVAEALQQVAVPVVAHRNVSASGSLHSWFAAGRRPLVRDGAYAREMAALREGSVTLFDDDSLADRVAAALRRPAGTWLRPGADLTPCLPDAAAAYLAWWGSLR